MTYVAVLILGFLAANFLWFVDIYTSNFFEMVSPKFVANSFDSEVKEELDSVLLKSLKKYIQKYFYDEKQVREMLLTETGEEQPLSEAFGNYTTSEEMSGYQQLEISNSSKVSMFMSEDGNHINILKIANDAKSESKFEYKSGEVSLYSIPVDNFLISKPSEYKKKKSYIKKCWSSSFQGRIYGAVTSNDRTSLAIFYRVVKGHNISFRLRYFHQLSCEANEINRSEKAMQANFEEYMSSSVGQRKVNHVINEDYFEITNSEARSAWEEETHNLNYFDDTTYDDFKISGNTPIVAMAIKKDTIAYARNLDYRDFYVIKRNKGDDGQRTWAVSLLGPKVDKSESKFSHTNSLKFLQGTKFEDFFIHVTLEANTNGIFSNVNAYAEDKDLEGNKTAAKLFHFQLEVEIEILNDIEDFSVESTLQNLKGYMKPTLYSSVGNSSVIFEIIPNNLARLSWDENVEGRSLDVFSRERKVSKLSSDSNNDHIFIKTSVENNLLMMSRQNDEEEEEYVISEVSMKGMPKRYRKVGIASILYDKVGSRNLLFVLNEDAKLLAFDLTSVTKKNRIINFIYSMMFSKYSYPALVILCNLIILMYTKLCRNRSQIMNRRNQEINQVVQDIIRLNNMNVALSNNLSNLGTQPQSGQGGNSNQGSGGEPNSQADSQNV